MQLLLLLLLLMMAASDDGRWNNNDDRTAAAPLQHGDVTIRATPTHSCRGCCCPHLLLSVISSRPCISRVN